MRIGIDFDGVIVRIDEINRTRISDALASEYGIKIVNPDRILWAERYDNKLSVNKELNNKFLKQYFRNIVAYEMTPEGAANLTPIPNAVESIKKLKELKHELHLITARGVADDTDSAHTKRLIGIVNNKLNELGLVFDQCHFGKETKTKIAQELGIDLMIDDKYSHIKKLIDANIPTIQLINSNTKHQRYATDIKGVKLATDWKEIVAEVERLSSKAARTQIIPGSIQTAVSHNTQTKLHRFNAANIVIPPATYGL
jgi:beta-phosphoglucomutase-like phosphatase (HAD superfamily)